MSNVLQRSMFLPHYRHGGYHSSTDPAIQDLEVRRDELFKLVQQGEAGAYQEYQETQNKIVEIQNKSTPTGEKVINLETGNEVPVTVQDAKETEQEEIMSGIMEGFDDETVSKAVVPAMQLGETLYPRKSGADYLDEAKELYPSDVSDDRALIQRQKEEDKIAGLMALGLGLLGGKGKPMEILAQAGTQALGAYMPLRSATRKGEAALVKEERALKTAQKKYVLSQQQEDDANRLKLQTDAIFANLGFLQEISKQDHANQFKLETERLDMFDKTTGDNALITLGMFKEDLKKPEADRRYSKEIDVTKPFTVFDKSLQTNVLFSSPQLYKEAAEKEPKRYLPKNDAVTNPIRKMVYAQYVHPVLGKQIEGIVQELKDGTYAVPNLTEDGDVILDNNLSIAHIPNTDANLIPMQDVALTAADLPKEKQLEQLGTILLYDNAIRSLDKVISNIQVDPSRAGTVGNIRSLVQRGKGILSDLISKPDLDLVRSAAIEDSKFTHLEPNDADAIRALFDPSNPDSARFWGDFDPALAENRTRINGIAYVLARARKTSGRLNLDDIQRAYADLTESFGDSKTVLVKLNTIREEMSLRNNNNIFIFGQSGGTLPANYQGTSLTPDTTKMPLVSYDNEEGIIKDLALPGESP